MLGLWQEAAGQKEGKKKSKTSEKISSGNPQFNVMAHVGGWPTLHGRFFFFFKKRILLVHHCS